MRVNPEQWFDKHKAKLPADIVAASEKLRMYLRGWLLFDIISEPLAKEMIDHALLEIDSPHKVPLLYETLTDCANYYILNLCAEAEALISYSNANLSTELVEEGVMKKNELFEKTLNQEDWEDVKILLQETIDIFQRTFFAKRKELLDIESQWWKFYKFSFQYNGMKWQLDACKIISELRKGKKPNELTHLTHQEEFNAVKELIEAIEEVERNSEG